MNKQDLPLGEATRLKALRDLHVLDTAPEREFEALVNAAALVCGTPVSLITLVEQDRQWFKANFGLPGATETPRDISFCAHAIYGEGIMEVEDATADPRFADNPLVTGKPDFRFYAGVPLTLSCGENVGTLCVIGHAPHKLTPEQREILGHLGYAATRALEARLALDEEQQLRLTQSRAASIVENSLDAIVTVGTDGIIELWNAAAEEMFGYTAEEAVGRPVSMILPLDSEQTESFAGTFPEGREADFRETFRRTRDGRVIPVSISTGPVYSKDGEVIARTDIIRDISESVAAKQGLNEERQRLQNILEGTGAGTWEWNVQTGETRYNERWAEIIGYTLDELKPISIETWLKHTEPDDLEGSRKALKRHFDGETETYRFEARMRHKSGHWVWVLDRGKVITRTPDGKPEWMFGTRQDINERKLQQDDLRKSQIFLDKTGRLAGIGGWEMDLVTGEIIWSDETCRIHGLEPGYTPVLEEALNFYAPEARSVVQAAVEKSIETGEGWDIEVPFNRADGIRIWVRTTGSTEFDNGVPVRLAGAFQDITEQVEQRLALEVLSERQAVATENGRIGIWDADLVNRTTHYSEMWCQLLGYTRTEMGDGLERWLDLLHPDDRERVKGADLAHIAGKTPFFEEQIRMRHKNGSWVWILDRGRVIARDAEGKPTRMIGTHIDITSQKQAEEKQLELAERITLATDSGGIGIWEVDLVRNEAVWDSWMYRLFGVNESHTEPVAEIWRRHVHPEDLDRMEQAVKRAIVGVAPLEEEYRIIHPDNSIHYIRVSANVTSNEPGRALKIVGAAWDVTRVRTMALELEEQHELLRVTLHSIGDAVMTTDARGIVQWLNPVAERMTGWSISEAEGKPSHAVFNIVHEETRQTAPDPIAACLDKVEVVGLDHDTMLLSRDGREFSIEDSAAPIRSSDGETLGAVLVFHDVSEQRRLSREMRHRATHDPLTGLINRVEFDRRLASVFEKSVVEETPNALLYIDLDQFKIVNDSCGHAVGDVLLKQVSKLLCETIRSGDTLARLGGDEFAVILQRCSIENATRIAQNMCDRMSDFRFVHGDKRFRVGTSIGLVPVDGSMPSVASILQAADSSCYVAKEAGRNRVQVWVDSDEALATRSGEMRWASRIEQALDEDRFVLFVQDIRPFDGAASGRHAELLIRMKHEDGSLISPSAFLPSAERFNLASRIDRWVLSRAVEWIAESTRDSDIATISLNLSGQSVGDRSFHLHALEVLEQAGEDICTRLCFEITETAAITNLADASSFIEKVREKSVRVALDDFGAGASSFGYLKRFPVDYLKIDGQFIRDLIDDPLNDATVRCFVEVARVLGIQTIAEYVGDDEVMAKLKEIGVDFGQGFHLHKPEPLRNQAA
ncbi:PAS domain S-box-containing protein/diguanylate cyclase (GGDEF)-like protein [Hoeflea halophila]|uniref:PAS domain S-box-containing protein/diguanylate cyclase (GGDEF)-like protein n=1 Tax=Hoeflea halophila TaxID=714899 RepID=A0A286ICX0_9HYPH|nr:PAS domain-containing protein [Hoeflea halophila]SOE17983.1 PAS domain S-box-containing protein/diguanylate cyclase (GGDEF)-like protein [Hoeflea halophila]